MQNVQAPTLLPFGLCIEKARRDPQELPRPRLRFRSEVTVAGCTRLSPACQPGHKPSTLFREFFLRLATCSNLAQISASCVWQGYAVLAIVLRMKKYAWSGNIV